MDDQPNLPVGKVKVKKGDYGNKRAVFEVKNLGVTAQNSARIGIVCFDKSDKIIPGTDYTSVQRPAGCRSPGRHL